MSLDYSSYALAFASLGSFRDPSGRGTRTAVLSSKKDFGFRVCSLGFRGRVRREGTEAITQCFYKVWQGWTLMGRVAGLNSKELQFILGRL